MREVDEGGEKRGNSVERWWSVEEVFVGFVVVVVVVVVIVIVVVWLCGRGRRGSSGSWDRKWRGNRGVSSTECCVASRSSGETGEESS